MTKRSARNNESHGMEISACGVRRPEVDINQLALAYYLLARQRIESRKAEEADPSLHRRDEAA